MKFYSLRKKETGELARVEEIYKEGFGCDTINYHQLTMVNGASEHCVENPVFLVSDYNLASKIARFEGDIHNTTASTPFNPLLNLEVVEMNIM